jgi:hypothetical protein
MRNLFALLVIGVIVYTIISFLQRGRSGPAGTAGTGGRRTGPPSGPVAPDDDPAFIWKLGQQRRRAERDAKGPDPSDDGSDQDQPGPRGATP